MYLEQVFTQILKMSMTAGWCILAVLVLHLIFHKAPKKYLYALWLVVAFRLLCPFSISTPVGIFQGEQTAVGQTVSEQTSVEQAAVLRSDNSSKVQRWRIHNKFPSQVGNSRKRLLGQSSMWQERKEYFGWHPASGSSVWQLWQVTTYSAFGVFAGN